MKRRTTTVIFWGTRGSIPTPGKATVRYGGNTSCVEVRCKNESLILDGGSGIRLLGLTHQKNHFGTPQKPIQILLTHDHLDHIVGLPFFSPALKNLTTLQIFGPPGIKKALGSLFPFPILPAKKKIREITPGKFRVGSFKVTAEWSNHPGKSLGYRITTPTGETIVYMSDHEPLQRFSHNRSALIEKDLQKWVSKADLLIMDSQYFAKEYKKRKGWGHSPLPYTVDLALKGKVKRLALFHHDPGHSDTLLKKKLGQAKGLVSKSHQSLRCFLATEGKKITL